eukprot:5562638-Pleurochrysis_carterae.AAC.3
MRASVRKQDAECEARRLVGRATQRLRERNRACADASARAELAFMRLLRRRACDKRPTVTLNDGCEFGLDGCAPAGARHVVGAFSMHAHRHAVLGRRHRRKHGRRHAARQLAAVRAANMLDAALNLAQRHLERRRHAMLRQSEVLRRADDVDAVLRRRGYRAVGLELPRSTVRLSSAVAVTPVSAVAGARAEDSVAPTPATPAPSAPDATGKGGFARAALLCAFGIGSAPFQTTGGAPTTTLECAVSSSSSTAAACVERANASKSTPMRLPTSSRRRAFASANSDGSSFCAPLKRADAAGSSASACSAVLWSSYLSWASFAANRAWAMVSARTSATGAPTAATAAPTGSKYREYVDDTWRRTQGGEVDLPERGANVPRNDGGTAEHAKTRGRRRRRRKRKVRRVLGLAGGLHARVNLCERHRERRERVRSDGDVLRAGGGGEGGRQAGLLLEEELVRKCAEQCEAVLRGLRAVVDAKGARFCIKLVDEAAHRVLIGEEAAAQHRGGAVGKEEAVGEHAAARDARVLDAALGVGT